LVYETFIDFTGFSLFRGSIISRYLFIYLFQNDACAKAPSGSLILEVKHRSHVAVQHTLTQLYTHIFYFVFLSLFASIVFSRRNMGVFPSRDFCNPHFERNQPDDNFHFASWGKIRFIQKFINILETWGSRCLVKMLNHMNFMNNSVY
jgi:hypothetical protein